MKVNKKLPRTESKGRILFLHDFSALSEADDYSLSADTLVFRLGDPCLPSYFFLGNLFPVEF